MDFFWGDFWVAEPPKNFWIPPFFAGEKPGQMLNSPFLWGGTKPTEKTKRKHSVRQSAGMDTRYFDQARENTIKDASLDIVTRFTEDLSVICWDRRWSFLRFSCHGLKTIGTSITMKTHVSFIFKGYNPYFLALKPLFFMVLGSKGTWILSIGKKNLSISYGSLPGCNRHHQDYEPFLGSGIPN